MCEGHTSAIDHSPLYFVRLAFSIDLIDWLASEIQWFLCLSSPLVGLLICTTEPSLYVGACVTGTLQTEPSL